MPIAIGLDQPLTPPATRTIGAVVASHIALFILVTSLPAFQAAHHHWIFPVLAAFFALQWGATFALKPVEGLIDARSARGTVLTALGFLIAMGIARHATILTCFDRCSLKLAAAALIAAPVFFFHRRTEDEGFWDPLRAGLAALGCLLWAAYLALRGLQLAPWSVNLAFAILGCVFWLGRTRPTLLIASLGVFAGLMIRATANEFAIIGLGTVFGVALPLLGARRVRAWLELKAEEAARAEADEAAAPGARTRWVRTAAVTAATAALGVYVIGPTFLMTNPAERRARLKAVAPEPARREGLSPLAERLRGHVEQLARTIGERDAFQRKAQERARDYVVAEFRKAGYKPRVLPYRSVGLSALPDGTTFYNVEAARLKAPADLPGIWVIGAHYDSAPGTAGADDNASGVAVLLEAARLLKDKGAAREIRFVAFGTEEPPAFGTKNMGSYHYALGLKETGAKLHGMVSLEMLGYYNPRKGSQLYPPFLHLVNPDHGDFAGAAGNVASRRLLSAFKGSWDETSSCLLTTAILPGPFSGLALSDQLNFWDQGYPALLLSDTAFFRNPHYHQETDTPDTLDYERMAEVTRSLVRILERS